MYVIRILICDNFGSTSACREEILSTYKCYFIAGYIIRFLYFSALPKYVIIFVNKLEIPFLIYIIIGNDAIVNFYLNTFKTAAQVTSNISNFVYMGGNTNTTGGLRVMRTEVFTAANGDRPAVPNICILITDGIPTREVAQLPAEVTLNKNLGVRIIGIGVSAEVTMMFVNLLKLPFMIAALYL